MCVNLPVVDPTKVNCPVMIFRGDHDGIATDEDVLGFFNALPDKDKQLFVFIRQSVEETKDILVRCNAIMITSKNHYGAINFGWVDHR